MMRFYWTYRFFILLLFFSVLPCLVLIRNYFGPLAACAFFIVGGFIVTIVFDIRAEDRRKKWKAEMEKMEKHPW
jgi:Flp pilus assembly protein TadB